jgi:hypothetical protein
MTAARCILFAACGLSLCACGSDPRTKTGDDGSLAFAPVKTGMNAEPARGAPALSPSLPLPPKGFVLTESHFGSSTNYAFDAGTGMLTGIWSDPDLSGSGANPPMIQKHDFKLSADEKTALIKEINLAWGARHPIADFAGTLQDSPTIWLIDGAQYKAIDGRGAGGVIAASLVSLAQTHGVVRDDHEH